MKAIIIEDEQRAQIYLKAMLMELAPEIEVVATCDDLPSGVIAIRKHKPELVFLDIEMPKYNGLDIIHFFDDTEMNFSIIFTTAYNQYAIQAFKTNALDYLLKPIDPNELIETIGRYKKLSSQRNQLKSIQNLLQPEIKIAVPDGNSLIMISPQDIVYLKADNSYTIIHLNSGKKWITSRLLKNFEIKLNTCEFIIRIHKSYMINMNYVDGFSKSNGGTVILQNNIEVPISAEKVEMFLQHFSKIPK
ncbi:MAG: LytR/AlgR family response regulator transcription factor [Flavobacterium sp.]